MESSLAEVVEQTKQTNKEVFKTNEVGLLLDEGKGMKKRTRLVV